MENKNREFEHLIVEAKAYGLLADQGRKEVEALAKLFLKEIKVN